MSLLMDALKKAEEEKKRAARQLQEVEEPARDESSPEAEIQEKLDTSAIETREKKPATDHLELTLEPLDPNAEQELTPEQEKALDDTHEELIISREIVEEAKEHTDEQDISFSESLTLENAIQNDVPEGSLEETQEAVDLNDTSIIESLSSEESSAPSFDDTFHGVILDDEDENPYEETLPGVSADQLAKDLGGGAYQPTPVAAKTVFSAGRSKKKKNSFKWGVLSILVILAFGSFAVFYYFSITPVARQIPPPDVARGIETTPAALPVIPAVTDDNVSGTLIAQPEQPAAAAEATTEPTSTESAPTPAEPVLAEVVAPEAEEILTEPKTLIAEAAVDEPQAAAEPMPAPTPAEDLAEPISEQAELQEQLPEYLAIDQRAIRITKNTRLEEKALLVNQGFDAFQAGNLTLAKSMYEDALRLDADNRDARLGMAAIAIKQNDVQQAFMQYSHLLELNPDDAIALAAMQALNQQADPVRGESAIKLLLAKVGDNAYLYFNLGNLYARQKRWPEAQNAFFDAYRLDNDNADYALNLAISLDHLQQYAAALEYYESALKMAIGSDASFDYVAIRQRADTLATTLNVTQ